MLSVLLCVLLCACVLLALRLRASRGHELPPACKGSLPLIGITHLIMADNSKVWSLMESVGKDTMKKGGVTSSRIGIDRFYFVTDPEDALTIANTCLDKPRFYKFGEFLIGQGLIISSGSKWKRHRKLLNPAFTASVTHGFMETFNRQAEKLNTELAEFAGKGPFEATYYIQNISLQASCLNTFGTTSFHDEELFKQFLETVDQAMNAVIQRFVNIWQHSDLLYKLSGLKKKQDVLAKTYTEMTNRVIQKTAAALKEQHNYRNIVEHKTGAASFLEIMLPLRENNSLSDQEFKEELDTIVGASFETTAQLLEAILILVGSHPQVQERLYDEMMQIVGQERDVDKEDLRKLVYTEAVINECLRFQPTAPVLPRCVSQDVKLKNYTARAGSLCFILAYGIHRDPVWGPDADQFRPERWLEPDTLPDISTAFIGFSLGKRSCIGKMYAMTSLKVSLVHLVRKYHVMGDHNKLQFTLDVTLKPVKGNEISLLRRKKDYL
ncbi:cytochrome P450 4V2-like isoform X2 [Anticarsia gemmatalis]|uniref:cytochrome P450 4V2-like isoform X2 n=1 Tax=Anticarsia gemmatalis TaxID=129554 RepID=UPI003F76E588